MHREVETKYNTEYDDLNIKPEIVAVLKKHGMDVGDFFKCMKRGLSAKKVDRDGDETKVDDMNVQHKFFQSGMEFLGLIKQQVVLEHGDKEADAMVAKVFEEWKNKQVKVEN